jgi:hypothetical protein
VKSGGSLSFLVGTISNILVMEIGWTDVGSGGYILVSCAHSNTSFARHRICLETDGQMDGHGETSIPPYNFVAGGIMKT